MDPPSASPSRSAVTSAITNHPRIEIRNTVVTSLAQIPRPAVICTGPLTDSALAQDLRSHFDGEFLYFFDAIAPIVDADMRRRMGEVAVRVAQAANYTNAGTVEFLVDEQKNFYFLEMNTRLQVEHPVTELITGLDLVHLQVRIAAGEKLPFKQDDMRIRGHAIECRIYAEDPDNNYFPSPGKITLLQEPSGPGIRLDGGMYEGWTVPIDYDPLLAKLIGYGTDREHTIARLARALDEYFVGGIKTNISLFRRILRDADFRAARLDTGFLDRMLKRSEENPDDSNATEVAAIASGVFATLGITAPGAGNNATAGGSAGSAEKAASNWKNASRTEALR